MPEFLIYARVFLKIHARKFEFPAKFTGVNFGKLGRKISVSLPETLTFARVNSKIHAREKDRVQNGPQNVFYLSPRILKLLFNPLLRCETTWNCSSNPT